MRWTREEVAEIFQLSVKVARSQPRVGPRATWSAWPEVLHSLREFLRMEKLPLRWQPTRFQIACWEASLEWICLLESEDDRRMVWARAARLPWKIISHRFFRRLSRQALFPRWLLALDIIIKALNNPKNPLHRRHRHILEALRRQKSAPIV